MFVITFIPMNKCMFVQIFIGITEASFLLAAIGESRLLRFVKKVDRKCVIPELVRDNLLGVLREYLIVGGLPEVVDTPCI